MRLGLHVGSWGKRPVDAVPAAREADRLGFDSVWTAEAWGSDAVSTISWIAAHTERIGVGTAVMQIPARTPAATAMTAITLDHLSGGRFRLGLGMSGPQVVEGWHGAPYDHPLERTREYVEVVRAILRRDVPVEHHGDHYPLPITGGTGLGKPLRSAVQPLRADVPVYLAAMGPRNVALAAETADGWLPILFSPHRAEVFGAALAEGFAHRARDTEGFDIAPVVPVAPGEDLDGCRDRVRPFLALYVGGMGARGRNFYFDLVCRYGFRAAAERIQDLYLSGKLRDAAAAVPDELIDELALVGPPQRLREQLAAFERAGATTLLAMTAEVEAVRALAEANA